MIGQGRGNRITTKDMDKYIEVNNRTDGTLDRYHIKGVDVDEFIDVFLVPVRDNNHTVIDITKEEFESHKNRKHSILFNVEDRWTARHYKFNHTSKYWERKWNRAISKD